MTDRGATGQSGSSNGPTAGSEPGSVWARIVVSVPTVRRRESLSRLFVADRVMRLRPVPKHTVNTTPSSGARDDRRRKSVLVCPDCDHESAPTGDWVVSERHDRTVYDCPDCGTTITTRGLTGTARRDGGVEAPADD